MANATLRGMPDAGNPHVQFDDGEVASAKPRRGSLFYKILGLSKVNVVAGFRLRARLLATAGAAVFAASALAADDTPYLQDNLQLWFRADKGLETNETGAVTVWRNQGKIGASADVMPVAVSDGGRVTVTNHTKFGDQPALVFDGSAYLQSEGSVATGLTADGGAWFVVLQSDAPLNDRVNTGIFGGGYGTSNNRFGAFLKNPQNADNGKIAGGYVYKVESATSNDFVNAFDAMSCVGWKSGGKCYARTVNNWTAGTYVSSEATVPTALSSFNIGHLVPALTWMKPYAGSIAEIRVYNRPLTRRERVRIQFELFAHYGQHWASHGNIDDGALKLYANSVQMDGFSNEGLPEAASSTVECGGLVLSLDTPSKLTGACSYLTHTDAEGLARAWYFSSWGAVRSGSALTFSFDASNLPGDEDLSLVYGTDSSSRLAVAQGVRENGRLIFHLPAGWANGWYRLGHSALAGWYRADASVVTNAAGQVTQWKNLGLAGSTIDVFPTNRADASHVAWVADAVNGRPAVRFDGKCHLAAEHSWAAANTITYTGGDGKQASYVAGATWFVVMKANGTNASRTNRGPIGFPYNNGDSTKRACLFFASPGSTLGGYIFQNSANWAGLTVAENMGWSIVSLARWSDPQHNPHLQMFVDGQSSTLINPVDAAVWAARFQLGHPGMSWAKAFDGDIAEVRLYKSQLNAETLAIEEIKMAARYGISVKTAGLNRVPPVGFLKDAQAFNGRFAQYDGSSHTNAVSGELELTCLTAGNQETAKMSFVGHDAGAWFGEGQAKGRAERMWLVTTGGTQQTHRFAFSGVSPDGSRCRLLYRATTDGRWRCLARSDVPVFDITDVPSGYYTLEIGTPGFSLLLR